MSDHQADYPTANHVSAAGCLPQRLLCMEEAAAIAASEADVALIAAIQMAHAGSRGTYGAPHSHAELAA